MCSPRGAKPSPIRCAGASRWCAKANRPRRSPAFKKNAGAGRRKSAAALEKLRAENRIVAVPVVAGYMARFFKSSAENILAAVEKFHTTNPQRAGIGREELLAELGLNPAFLEAATDWLVQSKRLERSGALLARAGWNSRMPERDQKSVRPDRREIAVGPHLRRQAWRNWPSRWAKHCRALPRWRNCSLNAAKSCGWTTGFGCTATPLKPANRLR